MLQQKVRTFVFGVQRAKHCKGEVSEKKVEYKAELGQRICCHLKDLWNLIFLDSLT